MIADSIHVHGLRLFNFTLNDSMMHFDIHVVGTLKSPTGLQSN